MDKIKEEIEETGIADQVDEGEEDYTGSGTRVMVIPAPHRIKSAASANLEIRLTLYVLMLTAFGSRSLKDMRKEGYRIYNKLMEDVTHGGTCWVCLPQLFHPGFVQYADQNCVGVQMIWEARFHQAYSP